MGAPLREKVRFVGLTFQATANRVEPLEQLKQDNVAALRVSIGTLSADWLTVEYPEGEWDRQVRNMVSQQVASAENPALLIDISCMPRAIILALGETLSGLYERTPHFPAFIMYSTPQRYPVSRYAAEVGRLKAVKAGRALAEIVEDSNRVDAVIFLGRQGFDAKQFIDSLPRGRRINAHLFFNRDNPLHSLEVSRANQVVLNDETVTTRTYLTMESAHEKLMEWARTVPVDQAGLYLVAPFGPKPLAFSSALALGAIGRRGQNANVVRADVVVLGGHQYSTPYSLGLRQVCLYKMRPEDFR
jgi:hypothetical protein